MESAEARQQGRRVGTSTQEDLTRQRERESIELSRTRVLQDIASARSAGYREQLKKSLAFLDEKLAALEQPRPDQKAKSQTA